MYSEDKSNEAKAEAKQIKSANLHYLCREGFNIVDEPYSRG
jgi:hypothetical protein